jgi:hypothetical protein
MIRYVKGPPVTSPVTSGADVSAALDARINVDVEDRP